MKVLGLITEYNPFHNGHLFHLRQSKALSGADYTLCVMSGNFIQRGEPALINKWARARMALEAGVDAVIELPTVYAMASAEFFAHGAVSILEKTGIVDFICFGSEHGRIEALDSIAKVLVDEPESYKAALRLQLSKGISFPAARELAVKDYFKSHGDPELHMEEVMGSSNNILGIEYLKAIRKLESRIIPLTIRRVGSAYNSAEFTGGMSSATSIRKHLQGEPLQASRTALSGVLPAPSLSILSEELQNGRGPVFPADFENILLAGLRKASPEELQLLPDVSEGLENRIKEAACQSGTFSELVDNIATKRYPRTRVQRILFNSMLGVTSDETDRFNRHGGPQYIRVLGFNKKGRELLSQMNRKASLPVVVKTADFKNSCNPLLKRMLELESLATDLYVLGCKNPAFRKAGQEFTQNVLF